MASKPRYEHGEVTCMQAIRAALTPEEYRGFVKGNVLKYVWRERYKGRDADLFKAEDYLHEIRTDKWIHEDAAETAAEAVQHGRIIAAIEEATK